MSFYGNDDNGYNSYNSYNNPYDQSYDSLNYSSRYEQDYEESKDYYNYYSNYDYTNNSYADELYGRDFMDEVIKRHSYDPDLDDNKKSDYGSTYTFSDNQTTQSQYSSSNNSSSSYFDGYDNSSHTSNGYYGNRYTGNGGGGPSCAFALFIMWATILLGLFIAFSGM